MAFMHFEKKVLDQKAATIVLLQAVVQICELMKNLLDFAIICLSHKNYSCHMVYQ